MHVELDGQKIFEWRYWQAATQEQMAQMAGMAPGTLRRVENNRGAVTLGTARKIARVMGVAPKSLGRAKLRRVK